MADKETLEAHLDKIRGDLNEALGKLGTLRVHMKSERNRRKIDEAVLNTNRSIDILDGENVIRLTMSYDVWCKFTADAIDRRSY